MCRRNLNAYSARENEMHNSSPLNGEVWSKNEKQLIFYGPVEPVAAFNAHCTHTHTPKSQPALVALNNLQFKSFA